MTTPASERYTALTLLLSTLTPGSPEHTEAWRELEEIKNQCGGMVPKEKSNQ